MMHGQKNIKLENSCFS